MPKLTLPILFFLLTIIGCGYSDSADFLIPKKSGRIAVIFNQKNGQSRKYDNKRRIYEIPANGILLTQFKYRPGFIDYRYFLVDDYGNKTLLPIYKLVHNEDGTTSYIVRDNEAIGIFGHGTSVAYASNGEAPGLEVFISTFNGLDTIESMDHFNNRVDTLLGIDQ